MPAGMSATKPLFGIKEIDMSKAICALKAAFGVRGVRNCEYWRWVHYHNI